MEILAIDALREIVPGLGHNILRQHPTVLADQGREPNDPKLPNASFDRVLLIHMYHEIERPSEFLWHVRAALKAEGRVVVVDADRPTDRHGTPPRLLVCEFGAVGYQLTRFERLPDTESYFAQFEAKGPRPEPAQIRACPA